MKDSPQRIRLGYLKLSTHQTYNPPNVDEDMQEQNERVRLIRTAINLKVMGLLLFQYANIPALILNTFLHHLESCWWNVCTTYKRQKWNTVFEL